MPRTSTILGDQKLLYAIHDRVLAAIGIAATCFSLCGCGDSGPQRVSVSGTVTVDGAPLSQGAVHFSPADNSGPMVSVTVKAGTFEVPRSIGPLAGKSRVDVMVVHDLGFALDDDAAYAQAVCQTRKAISPTPVRPPEFANESQREVELDSDRMDLCFQLQTPHKRRGR